MRSSRVAIGNDQVGNISNHYSAGADDGVTPDGDAIRNAGAHPYCGTLPNFHESTHENAGSEAGEVLQGAIVVYRTARIENAELSDARIRADMSAGKNDGAIADLSGRGNDSGRMLDGGEAEAGAALCQIGVDFPAPPIVADGDYDVFDELLGTNGGDVGETAQNRMRTSHGAGFDGIVDEANDLVQGGQLNSVHENRGMARGTDHEELLSGSVQHFNRQ